MAVKKRAIWVDDADWAIISERAKPLNPSTYLRGLALKEPGNGQAADVGPAGKSEHAAGEGHGRLDPTFNSRGSRAVPKR